MSKILFVISSLDTGGAQRVLSNILLYLPKEWTIHILVNSTKSICFPYTGKLFDLGISDKSNRESLLYQGNVFIKRIRKIKKLKRAYHYDYVVSFLDSANIANILSRTQECTSIITAHTSLSATARINKKYKLIIQPLVKLLYNKADCLITVSKGVEQDYINNFKIRNDHIKTIYNGIDKLYINEVLQQQRKFSDNIFRICTMGRLEEEKGQWHLIRAVADLIKEGLSIELHILGEGHLENYLRSLAKNLGIDTKVFFEGFQNPPFSKIAECDLFAFPSLWEGFGNVIIEAAACGLPTISSDYESGAREILAPNTERTKRNTKEIEYAQYGILVPVCSGTKHDAETKLEPEEALLRNAIREMILNRDLYDSYKNKCNELANKFSMEIISRQWINLLERN